VPGSFKRTMRSLEWIQRYRRHNRPRLRVNFVMMRENFRDYPELVALAGQLGALDVVAMPVDTKQKNLRLSQRLIREYNDQIAPAVRQQRQAFGMPITPERVYPFGRLKHELDQSDAGRYASGYYEGHLCYAPYLHAFIAWDGKVYLCCMTNGRIDPLGDVSQQSLREIFLGEPFQQIRRQMERARLPSCHHCDMLLAENRLLHAALGDPAPMAASGVKVPLRLPLVSGGS
jgi:MoaA/NifB/PqqE/SkfB family radical SAM enzyme